MSAYVRKNNSIIKAAQLLEILEKAEEPMNLIAICDEIQMPRSTVHGLLNTMREIGIICQKDDTGKYWLGDRLTALGLAAEKYKQKEQTN